MASTDFSTCTATRLPSGRPSEASRLAMRLLGRAMAVASRSAGKAARRAANRLSLRGAFMAISEGGGAFGKKGVDAFAVFGAVGVGVGVHGAVYYGFNSCLRFSIKGWRHF